MTLLAPAVAAAPHDARAERRPGRGLDPGAPAGHGEGGSRDARAAHARVARRGDGLVPRIVREAEIDWEGTQRGGSGVVRGEHPVVRAFGDDRLAGRGHRGKTSPEELAAAHATCFVTSLGSELARMGTPPERMSVRCTITMDEVEGGHTGSSSRDLRARRRARRRRSFVRPGCSGGDTGCPFSALIRASATVTVEAVLGEGDF